MHLLKYFSRRELDPSLLDKLSPAQLPQLASNGRLCVCQFWAGAFIYQHIVQCIMQLHADVSINIERLQNTGYPSSSNCITQDDVSHIKDSKQ